MHNHEIVSQFLETVWNRQQFDRLDEYLHPSFIDYSLPPTLPTGKDGLRMWIEGTGKSFEHQTVVEDMVSEGSKTVVKIRMNLKHIGRWRDLEATFSEVSVVGYRFFRLDQGRIAEHWGLIDGAGLELQLKEAQQCAQGCKIQN